jgi:hypothetical protein
MPFASERETENMNEWDSSVGNEVGYGLEARWIGVRFLARAIRDFSDFLGVQTGSRVHPASYPMSTRTPFPGVKRPGREDFHLPLPNAEVKNEWSYSFTSPYVLMA